MKLTNTRNMKRKAGMTLLELTVVILVLLSLISILFIGARAWKKGSDRAGCILNIRNVQQAMRSHANLQNIDMGATLASTALIGSGLYLETTPMCPGDKTKAYTYLAAVPQVGTLYATCGNSAVSDHIPAAYKDW
jgi:type II secretory pathway pseudopilin PulG